MVLRKWSDLPIEMQTEEMKPYYESLENKKYNLFLKRVFDIVLSLILILVLFIPMVIIGIWIKTDSKGTVFFRQERVTAYGKKFRIYKFRTMVSDADKKGTLVTVSGDSRITKVGHKIRKCRIDEIPQLFNVLKGEMSFVGTRPEVQRYVNAYTNEMWATLLLPAGVTSTASINFRDEDKLLEEADNVDDVYIHKVLLLKMQYNLEYIKKFNIFSDLIICIKTII